MTLKENLQLLKTAWTTLSTKIKTKLAQDKKTITETTQKLNERSQLLEQTNHKLELTAKENSENEKVLEQLLKEFKELEEQL